MAINLTNLVEVGAPTYNFSSVLSSLAWDGSTANFFRSSISANESLVLSNFQVGVNYRGYIYNSHAANTIAVTIPTSINDPSPAYIPAQKYVMFNLIYDGNYFITYSGVLD